MSVKQIGRKSVSSVVVILVVGALILANEMTGVGSSAAKQPESPSGNPFQQILDKLDRIGHAIVSGSQARHPTLRWDQALPAVQRFDVLEDFGEAAVLDHETGLVWERSPELTPASWGPARTACLNKKVGGRLGWRLPSIQELSSLLYPSNEDGLYFPPGHPFYLSGILNYGGHWSATTDIQDSTHAWIATFPYGGVESTEKIKEMFASPHFSILFWCVRGGGPLSEY